MALSGTLETFSLPDVLQLLSSTKKTGLLALDGDRGTGRVWVEDGEIVAAQADRCVVDEVDAVLFELLRFADAAFEFDAGAVPAVAGDPHAVDAALEHAQARLEEWREIEAVVPSLDVRVRMVPEVDDAIAVDPGMWRLLARIGTGASGHDVAGHVGEGEFEVCRSLRDLVEAGMVEVTEHDAEPEHDVPLEAPAHEPLAIADAFDAMVHAPMPEAELDVAVDEPEPEVGALDAFDVTETADGAVEVEAQVAADEPAPAWAEEAAPVATTPADELAAIFGPTEAPATADAPEPDVDLFSDLAHLSPKAAAAVEATWGADAEPAAQAEVGPAPAEEAPAAAAPAGEGEDLDQNLLLRFLSSAKH
ncbi:MAG TPA: DUF4388 domain-containing protein [Acidimicrobiales bacterium]|nr:DUF4388 domain-containing protein [Acidimicrobiales bacterium]